MKDFFISYQTNDEAYATWVAEILEKNEYSVQIQAWDFKPSENFVSKINESLKICKKMIVILSQNYLQSEWCEMEWTSKLAEQVRLKEHRIVPIRVESITVAGLLEPIIYIDIVDKDEKTAEKAILAGIQEEKPRKSTNGYPTPYNIQHLEIDNDYLVKSEEIVYQKRCKSKVLENNFNKLHNRITWFSDEKVVLQSLTEGVTIEYLDLKDTNLNYNVVFDHNLIKDEVIEYCIQATLSNKNKHFDNFFETQVITPIDKLGIHLRLEDTTAKKYYTQKISDSPMNKRTEQPKEYNFYNLAHWVIEKPELHFSYKIYWD